VQADGGGSMMNRRSADVMSDKRLNGTKAQWYNGKVDRIPQTSNRKPIT